jgi:hypothetical protein
MIHLRPDLFRAAVRRLTGGEAVTFGTTDPTYRDWLSKKRLPEELKRFLIENSLSCEASFDGLGGMWTPSLAMELNDQEEALSRNGLFGVGNATNGDFIVIEFTTGEGQSGFVSHDKLWDEGPFPSVRDAFMPVAVSIGDMLHGMTSVEDFPYDYWRALDYPIMFNADVITEPRGVCLGTSSEQIQAFVESVRGRLVDRFDIEEKLRVEGLKTVARSNEAGQLHEWISFADEGDKWINDMRTVVFDFRRDNLAGGLTSLGFARDLLKLEPDEFEYFDIRDRVCVRMCWIDARTPV